MENDDRCFAIIELLLSKWYVSPRDGCVPVPVAVFSGIIFILLHYKPTKFCGGDIFLKIRKKYIWNSKTSINKILFLQSSTGDNAFK